MAPPIPGPVSSSEYTRLISLAVHEMRTPASVVGGYLRMLLNDTATPLDDRHRRMVEEAERSAARLVALLAELSDLGKLDAGVAAVKSDKLDLFELVHDVAKNVHESFDREVRLEMHGLRAGGRITGDRTRLRAALDVIVRAVMREQPAGTTVVVEALRVSAENGWAGRVVVAPAADVTRASGSPASEFDEFRGGLGLGLPIARRVLARHGGRIWSPRPPDGTELPLGSRGAIVVSLPLLE